MRIEKYNYVCYQVRSNLKGFFIQAILYCPIDGKHFLKLQAMTFPPSKKFTLGCLSEGKRQVLSYHIKYIDGLLFDGRYFCVHGGHILSQSKDCTSPGCQLN